MNRIYQFPSHPPLYINLTSWVVVVTDFCLGDVEGALSSGFDTCKLIRVLRNSNSEVDMLLFF